MDPSQPQAPQPVSSTDADQTMHTPKKTPLLLNIITILLLFFIFPVGILVMWFATKWPRVLKFALTGLSIVIIPVMLILAVVGLTVFTGLQRGARDSVRRSDVDQITIAIENHFDVANSQYPAVEDSWFSTNKIPQDPLGGSYEGIPIAPVNHFKICANIEAKIPVHQYCRESAR